eukprot:scaffold30254_cov107-Isochrysis_galbana.AAC.2
MGMRGRASSERCSAAGAGRACVLLPLKGESAARSPPYHRDRSGGFGVAEVRSWFAFELS